MWPVNMVASVTCRSMLNIKQAGKPRAKYKRPTRTYYMSVREQTAMGHGLTAGFMWPPLTFAVM